jgi:hypothetical protein
MNIFDTQNTNAGEEKERGSTSTSAHYRPPATNFNDRLTELEIENSRLHRLVAELLIKNEQLRKPD